MSLNSIITSDPVSASQPLWVILTLILFSSAQAQAQGETEKKATGRAGTDFYRFDIPAAINGSNINPSPFSAISFDLTDSKLAFKYGFPKIKKVPQDVDSIRFYGFVQGNVRAVNGIATVFKSGDTPLEFGINGGESMIIRNKYWVYKSNPSEISSQNVQWVSVRAEIQRNKYNIFSPLAAFGTIQEKLNNWSGSFFLSYNSFFYSELPQYTISDHILSGGIGYAQTNNYNSLKKRTFDEGTIHYNGTGTSYQAVVKSTEGAEGPFRVYSGLAAYVEAYRPLYRHRESAVSVYLGGRGTWYGVGEDDRIINASGGFFVNVRKKEGQKVTRTDVLNLALAARFDQLNNASADDYWENNFSVVLSASFPIKFN